MPSEPVVADFPEGERVIVTLLIGSPVVASVTVPITLPNKVYSSSVQPANIRANSAKRNTFFIAY